MNFLIDILQEKENLLSITTLKLYETIREIRV